MDEIRNLIARFANSFDLKDWKGMQSLLMDNVNCDYTSLRKTKTTLTAEEYVQQRINALEKLQTQHLFSNLEISISGDQATCRCSSLILRRLQSDFFNTHAFYEFTLFYKNDQWLIGKIKQEVLWNEGNPKIHAGVVTT
ncbi:MAG: nuclear transport factor 2 family protein [Verrucomicrobiae bacterium]|nr:nuclear transport factor 2 family protein [Verrucomicrobiae bacterium]